MPDARYLGTNAEAASVAALWNTKISPYPVRGDPVYFPTHQAVAAVWNGVPPTPHGWTRTYQERFLSGATWEVRIALPDAVKGRSAAVRATLTPLELALCDHALARMFPEAVTVTAERLSSGNPIVVAESLPPGNDLFANVNFPSLIECPAWLPSPLGDFRYAVFFGGHRGERILVGSANDLSGPWTLQLTDLDLAALLAVGFPDIPGSHLTTPYIYIDNGVPELRAYFHALTGGAFGHSSGAATSPDGLNWTIIPGSCPIGGVGSTPRYMSPFLFGGVWHAIEENCFIQRTPDPTGLSGFQRSSEADYFNRAIRDPSHTPRHAGRRLRVTALTTYLDVFFTRIGDAPERIMVATADLGIPDWEYWHLSPLREVLRPEEAWEGALLPVAPSIGGIAPGPVNQLRDPTIDDTGTIMTYAGMGEFRLGIAQLT